MKKVILILILGVVFAVGAFAQSNFDSNPKIKDLRKAFYNKELLFTDAEAAAFWPLFKEYQKEQKSLKRKYKVDAKAPTIINDDTAATKHIEQSFEYKQKENELKKKYVDKYSKVLPVRKVALIETTERKFKRQVLKKVRENRQKRKN